MRDRWTADGRARPMKMACAIAVSTLLAACAASGVIEPAGDGPYIVGPIASVQHHTTTSAVMVEAGPGSRDPCGIRASVDARTRVMRRTAGNLVSATSADLRVGETVEVYVDGLVMESCPLQGRAATMILIGQPAP